MFVTHARTTVTIWSLVVVASFTMRLALGAPLSGSECLIGLLLDTIVAIVLVNACRRGVRFPLAEVQYDAGQTRSVLEARAELIAELEPKAPTS